MNRLSFVVQEIEGIAFVMPVVDGRWLSDIVGEIERPIAKQDGYPWVAGSYAGIPEECAFLPSRHFLGEPDPAYRSERGGTYLMICECGEAACWPLEARITITDQTIQWSDFRNRRRPQWDYSRLTPITFERSPYEAMLAPQARPER